MFFSEEWRLVFPREGDEKAKDFMNFTIFQAGVHLHRISLGRRYLNSIVVKKKKKKLLPIRCKHSPAAVSNIVILWFLQQREYLLTFIFCTHIVRINTQAIF